MASLSLPHSCSALPLSGSEPALCYQKRLAHRRPTKKPSALLASTTMSAPSSSLADLSECPTTHLDRNPLCAIRRGWRIEGPPRSRPHCWLRRQCPHPHLHWPTSPSAQQPIWIGTRFVLSEEAGASKAHQEAVRTAGFDDNVRTLIFTGRPLRVRNNPYIQ